MNVYQVTDKPLPCYDSKAAAWLQGRHWATTVALIDLTDTKHNPGCPGSDGQCTCM